jgi:hypothetical protein
MKDASANDIGQWIQQHLGQAPFSHRVVTMDEIIAALPKFMQSRLSMKTVREALEYLGGVPWPTQIRPGGRDSEQLRVWLLGEAADKFRAGELRDTIGKGRKLNAPAEVLRMYREDHGPVAAVKVKTIGEDDAPALTDFGTAADDFGDDDARTIN